MNDREYLPLSWLAQVNYCSRRAALLLNERVWNENVETAKGRTEHERVHTKRIEKRGNLVKLYEYEVVSEILGIVGKCDCIEATINKNGCKIPAVEFPVSLLPIEYKHGTVRDEMEYKIQLCAQAMCLEEMYQTRIFKGELFFISSHKRKEVELDKSLRNEVQKMAIELRKIRNKFLIPKAEYSSKCVKCSMKEYGMPKVQRSARMYCEDMKKEAKGQKIL